MKHDTNEWRILWIRRGWLGVEPLDRGGREEFRVVRTDRFVEGEIVRLQVWNERSGGDERSGVRRAEVISSRIDPRYGPGPRPRLRPYTLPENDPAMGPYFAYDSLIPPETDYLFWSRVPPFPRENPRRQARICRELIEEHPSLLMALERQGELEWLRGRKERGLKYFETGWKTARLAFPPGFDGTFDHNDGGNMSVLWLASKYLAALAHFGREEEALHILTFLFSADRPGTWDADGLELPLLLRSGRLAELKMRLSAPEHLGVHEFLRALFLFTRGREEQAVRAICRGMQSNPRMLPALFEAETDPIDVPFREGPYTYADTAALQASLTAEEWRKRNGLLFLTKLLECSDFYRAYSRAREAAEQSDGFFPMERPFDVVPVIRECFSEIVTEATVRAATEP